VQFYHQIQALGPDQSRKKRNIEEEKSFTSRIGCGLRVGPGGVAGQEQKGKTKIAGSWESPRKRPLAGDGETPEGTLLFCRERRTKIFQKRRMEENLGWTTKTPIEAGLTGPGGQKRKTLGIKRTEIPKSRGKGKGKIGVIMMQAFRRCRL